MPTEARTAGSSRRRTSSRSTTSRSTGHSRTGSREAMQLPRRTSTLARRPTVSSRPPMDSSRRHRPTTTRLLCSTRCASALPDFTRVSRICCRTHESAHHMPTGQPSPQSADGRCLRIAHKLPLSATQNRSSECNETLRVDFIYFPWQDPGQAQQYQAPYGSGPPDWQPQPPGAQPPPSAASGYPGYSAPPATASMYSAAAPLGACKFGSRTLPHAASRGCHPHT